jgi:hypothetical protein
MKGVVIVVLVGAILAYFNIGTGMEPIETPMQYGQFCKAQKITDHGIGDV